MVDPLDLVRESKYGCLCLAFSNVYMWLKNVYKLNESNGTCESF